MVETAPGILALPGIPLSFSQWGGLLEFPSNEKAEVDELVYRFMGKGRNDIVCQP